MLSVSLTASSNRKSNGNDGSKRWTRSLSPLPIRRILDDGATDDGGAKRRRTSPRNLEFCVDIDGLPPNMFCDGCAQHEDLTKRKPRHLTKSREMQCSKLWKLKKKDVPEIKMAHWTAINDYVNDKR